MVEAGFATAADVRAVKARKICVPKPAQPEPMHTALTPCARAGSSRANHERPKRIAVCCGQTGRLAAACKPRIHLLRSRPLLGLISSGRSEEHTSELQSQSN